MSVTEILKKAIAESKLTYREVANRVNLSDVQLSHIVNGRRAAKALVAVKLERVLGVRAEDIVGTKELSRVAGERQRQMSGWGAVAPIATADENGMAS